MFPAPPAPGGAISSLEVFSLSRPHFPLGDYYQLLLKNGLLSDAAPLHADLTREVRLVSCDSQTVVPGTLFICKGAAFKPQYLLDAAEKGAFVYVSERRWPECALPCILVSDIRRSMALLADRAWDHPSGRLHITGITGTKGKTTTAYFLKSMLDEWRRSQGKRESAILSTMITDDGVERRPAKLTTPEPLDLQRHLWNAAECGAEYLTMEVSSQALKYHRTGGVEFSVGVFLNIGEDHISPVEHPDFEDYFASKLMIFRQSAAACVNLDSDFAERILTAAESCSKIYTFSTKFSTADIYASEIRRDGDATRFLVRTPRYTRELSMGLPGSFNVENALAAVAAAVALGVPESAVAAGLAEAVVPGRMETFNTPDGKLTVIVDYAHNGMSLEALLSSVRREFPGRQLTVLFGCTGGKGLDRREGMGQAAGRWADRIILTEDDPGPEEVPDICADIGGYIAPFGKTWTVIPDREEAVERAILEAHTPAVVVLAGKGAEQQQKRKNGPEPCVPDSLLARRALKHYDP